MRGTYLECKEMSVTAGCHFTETDRAVDKGKRSAVRHQISDAGFPDSIFDMGVGSLFFNVSVWLQSRPLRSDKEQIRKHPTWDHLPSVFRKDNITALWPGF